MIYGVIITLALVIVGLLVNLIWRLASQRQELPCPSWLGGWLMRCT